MANMELSLLAVLVCLSTVATQCPPESEACEQNQHTFKLHRFALRMYCRTFYLCNDCGANYNQTRGSCTASFHEKSKRYCDEVSTYFERSLCSGRLRDLFNRVESAIPFKSSNNDPNCFQPWVKHCIP